ncbi:hypothetical protein RYX36_010561 [Vicia faba]
MNFSVPFVQEFCNWESAWALEALFIIVYKIRVLTEKGNEEDFVNPAQAELARLSDAGLTVAHVHIHVVSQKGGDYEKNE